MDCPCGIEMKVKTEMNIRLREEVDVRFCMCGRERSIVVYGEFDKAYSCHDKFKILADKL